MNDKSKGMKVGGWLLFFLIVFALGAISALSEVASTFLNSFFPDYLRNTWNRTGAEFYPPIPSFAWSFTLLILSGILVSLLVATSIGIIRKRKWAKSLAIASVWFSTFSSIIQSIVGLVMRPEWVEFYSRHSELFGEFVSSTYYLSMASGILFSVAISILITLYFIRSERVKKTLVQ